MKILIATTSTGDTENIAAGLAYMERHQVGVFHYDQKSRQSSEIHGKLERNLRAATPNDQSAERVTCDPELVAHARDFNPDIILYISAWGAAFAPTNETLLRLKAIAPLVHLLFDGADPPWWPALKEMEDEGLFDLTVSIDGSHFWPGGSAWNDRSWRVKNGLTLLTPISPDFYPVQSIKYSERPFPIGYAGNVGGWMRKGVVERLQQENMPFVLKLRVVSTYADYAKFLLHCRIIVNVPFTGSGHRKHVKGRVIEAGLARACFVEWENPHLRQWFTPRLEFEEYGNPDECVEMCKFLVANVRRSEEIGHALYSRVLMEHDPTVFWGKVFDSVKFPVKASAVE